MCLYWQLSRTYNPSTNRGTYVRMLIHTILYVSNTPLQIYILLLWYRCTVQVRTVRTRTIIHGITIHGVFMSHEPVTPPMLRSILCPSLPSSVLVFSLSLVSFFISYHFYIFLRTWYNLYTILRMIPPYTKTFLKPQTFTS